MKSITNIARALGLLASIAGTFTLVAESSPSGLPSSAEDPGDPGDAEEAPRSLPRRSPLHVAANDVAITNNANPAVAAGVATEPYFQAECSSPACAPFNGSNSFVTQLAVSTAASNHAPVGSTIGIAYVPPPGGACAVRYAIATVTKVPTLNSSDLAFQGYGLCEVSNPRL